MKDSLPGKKSDPGRTALNNRKFISAIMWVARSGAAWGALPPEYGKWSSVHKRFIRWAKAGVWQMIFNTLASDADTEWVMIDTTLIRAHQHAAGARKKCSQGTAREQELGRSRGGLTTKIHAACDALGNPLRFYLTAGQKSDYLKALDLIEGFEMKALLGDKGYDANYVVEALGKAEAVIPPRSMQKSLRTYDKDLYKERNLVERMFNKIKHFRRVATRYDKLAIAFLSFVHIAAIYILLK
ncbi:MAG: IS5 family transposase [Alphaproteobacteria bacterium]